MKTLAKHKYTPDEKEFLFGYVPDHSHIEIMAAFNKKFNAGIKPNQIKAYIKNNKLNTGRTGWFKKGTVPFNKGKKGIEIWTPTQFQKGSIPHNTMLIGTEVVRDGYAWIKIANPNVWKQKHRLLWETKNGDIPENHVLIFADGDQSNICLNNLMMVSRKELTALNKNKLIKNDKKLTETGVLIAKLIVKTHGLKMERGK
ncbi:HNH endonuclease signature motif containing protein [Acetobacterium sp.]|uniref:HNH endonuclease signature motif containing protein n=1 Tax=Acetobacterium sp. TaxID=1872094 RepID=UPI002F420FA5